MTDKKEVKVAEAPKKVVEAPKKEEIKRATKKARALRNGQLKRTFYLRTGQCKFTNPKSLVHPKNPVYAKTPIANNEQDYHLSILRYPVKSEAVNHLIEKNNTVVFMVKREASKPQIKRAFNLMFKIVPTKINTLITPLGEKKAFIRLPKDVRAEDVAAGFTPK